MSTSTFKSVNLLPAYFQTEKNSKFLSSTLDQLIQPAQLDRINGYIGTKVTPTYKAISDAYIPDNRLYQLAPALIINNSDNDVQDVISYDDLYNEMVAKGGNGNNLDRLFRGDFYSYDPHVDWDKLINYQEYFWLVTGPDLILIVDDLLDVDADIIGKSNYSFISHSSTISLSNGMLIKFSGSKISSKYQDRQFFVEGVGTSITLVDYSTLLTPGKISTLYNENFDGDVFDSYPFDGDKTLPITPEYITINRASRDLNPWSRYNRWVHRDIITATATANGVQAVYPAKQRARRPIVEFKANLQLFNFGTTAVNNVDYIDTTTLDAFSTVEGSAGFYIDVNSASPVALQHGQRVIFNADTDPMVRGKIYEVSFNIYSGVTKLALIPTVDHNPVLLDSVSIISGDKFGGTCWWFNGSEWVYSQQHTKINQAPLFDLFDTAGISYSKYVSNFKGNQIFGYSIGEGPVDSILGFSLGYRQPAQGVGSYLFANYFSNDNITVVNNQENVSISTDQTYCKFSNIDGTVFNNVWVKASDYQIPILQVTATTAATSIIEITAIDKPATIDFTLDVFVNFNKIQSSKFTKSINGSSVFVNFLDQVPANSNVLFKIYTSAIPNSNGYYELPLALTNNPLNGNISSMTLSDLQDHLKTMVEKAPTFTGSFPGDSNLRDVSSLGKYGRRLITNGTPLTFSQLFLGKQEHNLVDAFTKSSDHYNQFKLGFLKQLILSSNQTDPVSLVDQVLTTMNLNKNLLDPYYLSDMAPYGTNTVIRKWTVTDSRNTLYPLSLSFDPTKLSATSTLVYVNNVQLLIGVDYEFDFADSKVKILSSLAVNDVLTVKYYPDTTGAYIPPTPTKLGLYPKFTPAIYIDKTYTTPTKVIQGHDGSIMLAYNDYRDDAILEIEKRIYNNIKVQYRSDLFDANTILPGAFRKSQYTSDEITDILRSDFIKWAGLYGIDYTANSVFNQDVPFTWNFNGSASPVLNTEVTGYWRSIYKYFYDTDRPHSHPWEMLGLSEKPTWWKAKYGEEPYTAGNTVMWDDIELGSINGVINLAYARPGLSNMLPVDDSGNLINPSILLTNFTPFNVRQDWVFGDQSPAETAWRRSSYWPFALQRLLALISPIKYSALMYDVSRMEKNPAGQWTYGPAFSFLDIKTVTIPQDITTLTSGYSVYVIENGRQRNQNYISELQSDIDYFDVKLFHKVGGFVSKDALTITIDAIDPVSTGPGAVLSADDYSLILNVSNPIKTINISGLIVQKHNGSYLVKGYDLANPYFNSYSAIRNSNTPTLNIGGISSPYVTWAASSTSGGTGLSSVDTTTANAASTQNFYQKGQIVKYGSEFYVVTTAHRSEAVFNKSYYQSITSLPIVGGTTVQQVSKFDNNSITQIPYGTIFSTIQDVYDLIVGYGAWLTDQGFTFSEYNSDLGTTIDWSFTAKEFLYWTTQNWSDSSIITLSPFANTIQYSYPQSVVDNIFDSFYDYKILNSSGTVISKNKLSVSRDNGVCTISSVNDLEGIYFATLRSVQKEHGIIFNNTSIFNDTIYNIETGFYQQRVLLSGFRTANWNGDYFNPGFVYDTANISKWQQYTDYYAGSVVFYSGNYYSAISKLAGSKTFNFTDWQILPGKPVSGLLPNFDYKINQFSDFYNLDIDNFDGGQQRAAQHLTGYTPRPYLNNIIADPIAQYKFYQGFIKEKGTQNAISKLAKSTIQNYQGNFTYNEEWAFRVGQYGSYSTYQELEVPLVEGTFVDNPQVVVFSDNNPNPLLNNLNYYSTASTWQIVPDNYDSKNTFIVNTGTYLENDFVLATAGYVREDDVTYTTLTRETLINSASSPASTFTDGDTVWIGFVPTKGWDVVRYTVSPASIVSANINDTQTGINFITDTYHNILVDDIISITGYDSSVDGIYVVTEVPTLTSFVVASSVSYVSYTAGVTGNIFKFSSVRFATFDNLPDNKSLLNLPNGTKIWIDDNGDGHWAVYEKSNNYNVHGASSTGAIANQQLGWSISKRNESNIIVTGSPNFSQDNQYGRVGVYTDDSKSLTREFFFYLDELSATSSHVLPGTTKSEFGYSVVYDDIEFYNTKHGLIFAGAPGATTTSTCAQSGLIKISSVDATLFQETEQLVITNPDPIDYARFGSSIYVQRNTTTNKLLMVGAPGSISTGTGTVFAFQITSSNNAVSSNLLATISTPLTVGSLWGASISGSDDASVIAVSAIGNSNTRGFVNIYSYNGTSLTSTQQILSPCLSNSKFGQKVLVSSDGTYLFVSAPSNINYDETLGIVLVYKNINGQFVFDQIITNPVSVTGLQFGIDIDINSTNDSLVISSVGANVQVGIHFDTTITFDSGSTIFYDTIDNSGVVYLYNRHDKRFIVAQELDTVSSVAGTDFGHSVVIDSGGILVGAPAVDNTAINSSIYYFSKIDSAVNGWDAIRSQDSLVSLDNIKRVMLINASTEAVLSYLDVIDPLKGRISGIADQELTYKLATDPAVYSIGGLTSSVNTNTNWMDTHVGELWWDVSAVKYQWYEQGDAAFRKNHWGKLFPGASIDVYEWVSTAMLPSVWAALADTPTGLTLGISGQPLFADDSVYSLKKSYDAATGKFDSYTYYYWVKNRVVVPDTTNRRVSAYDVASLINDPTNYGLQYASPISSDAIILANIAGQLVSNNVDLNIAIDLPDSSIPKHTEWLLLQEGSSTGVPNTLLEKKLVDSLLGHDSLGNAVPDPALTDRTRYGIGVRPRQTLFKDRLAALRNVIGYANSVLATNVVTGRFNFNNLTASEPIPAITNNLYDKIVEDNDALLAISTALFNTAQLQCTVGDGRIRSVSIVNPGFGYTAPPTVTISSGQGIGAKITSTIDSFGRVVSVSIDEAGTGYISSPTLTVRPYTVIVLSDSVYAGKWARFEYDILSKNWIRQHTQSYNTALYWNYIDWTSTDYNQYLDYTLTVDYVYQTEGLLLSVGNYVRVKDNGIGNYIILKAVASGGTFSEYFDIVFAENGTIKIADTIWNQNSNPNNYDFGNTYDQTLFDQAPDLELTYILTALRDDLFINELKAEWNTLFFKAVKYAFTEQKLLDWAFKTSFISITNLAGALGQPPVYKLTSSTNFENYIKEVKPYHTQLRTFKENYTILEPSNSRITDFESLTSPTDIAANPVREIDITIKFDRLSANNQIGNPNVVDKFVCDGSASSFELSWLAQPNKQLITITLAGLRVLWADYTIKYYTKTHNGYPKKFCKVVFLNYVPGTQKLLEISYVKSSAIQSATDRILNYYTATSGMPGLDLGQLMTGVNYPKTQIDTLPFDYSTDWDQNAFDINAWSADSGYYSATTTTSTATVGVNTMTLATVAGIQVGYYVNVTSTITNSFNSVSPTVTHISGNTISISSTVSNNISKGATIEFWSSDNNASILDSEIIGGDLAYTKATGSNNSDVIIDGYNFYTADAGYAPEELVPGKVSDSLGINVYTKTSLGAPTIYSGIVNVQADQILSFPLKALPMTSASVTVTSGRAQFIYATTGTLVSETFAIDWVNQALIIKSSVTESVTYTIVGVGGGAGNDAGAIDHDSISTNETSAQLKSSSELSSVKSAFVTVNGQSISPQTTSTDFGYVLTSFNQYDDSASVIVYNIPPSASPNTIQAWFFASETSHFNEINEQLIPVIGGQISYALSYPPASIGPVSSQVIVEVIDTVHGTRTIQTPPETSYYKIVDSNRTFPINKRVTRISGIYTAANGRVEVYVNGIKARPGFDFVVNESDVTITVSSSIAHIGDVIAVVDLLENTYGFVITDSTITVPVNSVGTIISVTTFANHDGMLLMTDILTGTPSGRYQISRTVLNTNCVWVWLNSKPLRPNVDYAILSDGITVQLSDAIISSLSDNLLIMSVSDQTLASNTIGYRIFNDMFNRVNFKRLSGENSTYLTQPLAYTDSEIHINDASAIIPPNPFKKIPGVVLIAGERVEFTKKDGNVLSQLRRGTLGTSPRPYSDIYTQVIDQSPEQTIPYIETILQQVQFTDSTASTYTISSTTSTVTVPYSDVILTTDGIVLSTATNIAAVDQVQVYYGGRLLSKSEQYYQDITDSYDSPEFTMVGSVADVTALPATIILNNAYHVTDTNQIWVYTNSLSNTSVNGYEYSGLQVIPPEFSIDINTPTVLATEMVNGGRTPTGSGWVLHENADTVQIQPGWIMQDANGVRHTVIYSGHNTLFNGWGVGFSESITVAWPLTFIGPTLQQITLNIQDGIKDNIKLVIIKKQCASTSLWNNGVSLLASKSIPALFLQAKPTKLPDLYYYGGDLDLITGAGFALTDENDKPLEGF